MKFTERKCRVCGCTWNHPCPGGCYWVEKDLCSVCVDKPSLMAHEEITIRAKDLLVEDRPLPTDIGRALLAGYEAAVDNIVHLIWTSIGNSNDLCAHGCAYADGKGGCNNGSKLCTPRWRGPSSAYTQPTNNTKEE